MTARCWAISVLTLATVACSDDGGGDGSQASGGAAGSSASGGSSGAGGSSGSSASGGSSGSAGSSGAGATGGGAGSSGSAGAAGSGAGGSAGHPPYAPGKFIPTFAIKYSNVNQGSRSAEETAKFDLLITTFSHGEVWKESSQTSWQELKKRNPTQLVFLYTMGPAEYNTANWGELGWENGNLVHGWDWMKQNHGIGSAEQWVEAGVDTNLPLYNTSYPNERIMKLGNADWIAYWRDENYGDLFGGGRGHDLDGVDGVFSDNTSVTTSIAASNTLEAEGTGQEDEAESWDTPNGFDHAQWKEDMLEMYRLVVPNWRAKNVLMIPNASPGSGHQKTGYVELDAVETASGESAAPFGAFEEGGFISPYGNQVAFHAWNWEDKMAGIKTVKNTRVLQMCHGLRSQSDFSLAPMDVDDYKGTNGWEALWFCIGSFMLVFDDVRGNGYVGFTRWSYNSYRFFDEFDPQFLHLGKALGADQKNGSVYLREFEDGWFVVNGPLGSQTTVQVPGGQAARVLHHGNFKDPDSVTPVTSFQLAPQRAVVVLKPGRQIGNQDN